jgi:hypothetical protein
MSCHHPTSARQTTTRQVNDEAQQTVRVCGRCGAVLDVGLAAVPQWDREQDATSDRGSHSRATDARRRAETVDREVGR